MASTTSNSVAQFRTVDRETISVTDALRAFILPLASLKLTVTLLVLATVVTFIATVDQVEHDIFEVKKKHFSNVIVEVPFQTFFVPRWFPDYQNVPGSFYIPSGVTILSLMLLNLTAAHVLRFRLQASGMKLVVGLMASLLAAGLTWAVIFNAQNPSGIQGKPPIEWETMWVILQIAVLAIACAAAFGFFTIERTRIVERILLATAAILMGGLLAITFFLPEKGFIGDSAMRILWQLAQATIAALGGFVACQILFKRKAGIVLLHLGVAGLMLNEIYVYATNKEHQMTISEGETVNVAQDIRATELAVIDVSDPEVDVIVTVPGVKLQRSEIISSDELPFDIKPLEYFPNSDVRKNTGGSLATTGMGERWEAVAMRGSSGMSASQRVNIASGYVELLEKSSGDSLGVYLVSQLFDVSELDAVTVAGKDYRISLRFKTDYKPFSLTLKDVRTQTYVGVSTAKSYESFVVLNDLETGTSNDAHIWMNNPLRYSDQTFYQSSLGTSPQTGIEYTVLQVVTNRGWMIPYVCCMFTVVGLCVQFGNSLLAYLEKRRSADPVPMASFVSSAEELKSKVKYAQDGKPVVTKERSIQPHASSRWLAWAPTIVLVGFFGLWTAGEFYKSGSRVIEKRDMRLDLLGQIPVTHEGRVKPLDTFARNTLRQLSKRETVADGNDSQQPAIRWLADSIFETEGYEDYRLFRIEDPSVLTAIDLPLTMPTPKRETTNRFRYTLAEILKAEEKMMQQLPNPVEVPEEQWTVNQKRLHEVAMKLQKVYGAKLTFGAPEVEGMDVLFKLQRAGKDLSSPLIPLIVHQDDEAKPWTSFMDLQNRAWLGELAATYKAQTVTELAGGLVDEHIIGRMREKAIQEQVMRRFLSLPDFQELLKKKDAGENVGTLLELVKAQFPPEEIEKIVASEGQMVDALIAQQRPEMVKMMEIQVAKVNGGTGKINADISETESLLLSLRPAYRAGDAKTFNQSLTNYLAAVNADPPYEMSPYRIKAELVYNAFSPFYLTTAIYLAAALVAMMAWIGWSVPINRAAFWLLMLGFLIHLVGIVMRVVISGRPPVTNLYSSAIFVSAVFVVSMLLVERMTKLGIGNVMAGLMASLALIWAWTMSISDGDTFSVLVAVLDTQFWLTTHVICISIGYAATFVAGCLGMWYVVAGLITPSLDKSTRRTLANVIYGMVCFGLLTSFFGTVLGGLWADDSWGRFWGWDPKENGALMIVLWNAVLLHARWGGMIRERGIAGLAIVGNVITLWSWKGVNSMGVGLHAYAGTEDQTVKWILWLVAVHILLATVALIPTRFWTSYSRDDKSGKMIPSKVL